MKVAVISGATGGIGSAIACKLLEEGFHVSLGARNPEDLTEKYGDEDETKLYAKYDATVEGMAESWVEKTIEKWGGIDVLVNCAGKGSQVDFDNFNRADAMNAIEVNMLGPWNLNAAVFEHLKESGTGRVIDIVSLAGLRPANCKAGYAGPKHGAVGVSKCAAQAGWESGIRVTTICTGWVNTDMVRNNPNCGLPEQDRTQPEDVAEIAHIAIEMPNSVWFGTMTVSCEHEPWM